MIRGRIVSLLLGATVIAVTVGAGGCGGEAADGASYARGAESMTTAGPSPSGRALAAEDATGGSIGWAMRSIERTAEGCTGEEVACTRITIRYPELESGAPDEVLERIGADLARRVGSASFVAPDEPVPASLEALADGFVADYRAYAASVPESAVLPWSAQISVEVLYRGERLVSLEIEDSSYLGGAHPISLVEYVTYDLATGEPLALGDLIEDGRRAELRERAERRFRQARRLQPADDLVEEGFFLEDGFVLNDNFAVTGAGLAFHYQPYEIGPYALGPTNFTVPWSDLEGVVRLGGPLAVERRATTR